MTTQSARKHAASMGPSGATVTALFGLQNEFGTKHLLDGMNSRAGHVNSGLASISTRNNSVTRLGCFGGLATTQANWMISFLSPNQGIGVG